MTTSKTRLLVPCAPLFAVSALSVAISLPSVARADFIPTSGTADFNASSNWDDAVVNGVFSRPLTGNLSATFATDTVLPGGLTFNYGSSFDLSLISDGTADRTVSLAGDISVLTAAGGRTTTIGGTATNQGLFINLNGNRTFSVGGTDVLRFQNAIADGVGGAHGITKEGAGTLAFSSANGVRSQSSYSGGLFINEGTVIGGANAQGFGTGTIFLGDSAVGGSKSAALLGGNNRTYANNINVRAGSSGTLLIGHYQPGGQGAAIFSGNISLANDLTIQGQTTGAGGGFQGVVIGGAITGGGNITKTGAGAVQLNGTSTYSGVTYVNEGPLVANVFASVTSPIVLGAQGRIAGKGAVGAISGSGRVAPGGVTGFGTAISIDTLGVLTAPSIDPGAGVDFDFEFTSATGPNWANPNSSSGSLNDVLRLTGASPLSAALSAGNEINIYLPDYGTFVGGVFTDTNSDFASLVSGATYHFYIREEGGSVSYNTVAYNPLISGVTWGTVQVDAAGFAGGTVTNGWAMQFTATAIPEPSACALLVAGLAGSLAVTRRRRGHRG